ncbi:MAG: DNA topoisomerase IB [Patescibacteria group bacterium]
MSDAVALVKDPVESAKEAGLRYFSEKKLTINRHKHGDSFRYIDKDDQPVTNVDTITRIKSLVLPPAWVDVKISPADNSHLQAIGTDEKGRKQYRYHPEWLKFRDSAKYDKLIDFGRVLPKIRSQVSEDMSKQGLPREKVLATIVKLLEKTMIRIGNDEYAKENKSYGLTTLQNRHVDVGSEKVKINFKGKSGQFHNIELEDRRLARLIGKLQDLPGQDLFQFIDDDDNLHGIDSADVNEYIQDAAGDLFTAKDFRTWRGTVLAAWFLADVDRAKSEKENKKLVTEIVKEVASELGNTPTVCRKCYIHPVVIDSFLADSGLTIKAINTIEVDTVDLLPEEKIVLEFLKENTA